MTSETHFPPFVILAATDMSPASVRAMGYARLFDELFGAATAVLHSRYFDMPPYFTQSQTRTLLNELKKSRKAAEAQVAEMASKALGFKPKTFIVEKPPVDAILKTAADLDADLLVIGTHGKTGLKKLWLGSVAENVLRLSDRPVLAVGPRAGKPALRRILAPVGWGETGSQSRDYAVALAQAAGAHLILLNAAEGGRRDGACPWSRDEIEKRCEFSEVQDASHPVESILRAARERKADLIVMGAQKTPSFIGSLFSSTTERVMRLTEAPLLLVPRAVE